MAKKHKKLSGKAKVAFIRRMRKGLRKAGLLKPTFRRLRKLRASVLAKRMAAHRRYLRYGFKKNPLTPQMRKAMSAINAPKTKRLRPKRRRKLHGAALIAHMKKVGSKRGKKGAPTMAKKKRKHRKSKSKKRSLAAKKAARTRAHKKAVRRRAAKKAARSRKRKGGGKKAYHRKHRRSRRRAVIVVKRVKARKWQVVRRPRKGRKGRLARAFMRRHRLKNPFGGGIVKSILNMLKTAAPVGAGFLGTKFVKNQILGLAGGYLPKILKPYAHPIATVAGLFGINYLTKKINILGKYKGGLMLGGSLALLDEIVEVTGLKDSLGGGPKVAQLPTTTAPSASEDYIETAAYEEMAAYEEAADYIETGEYVEGDPSAVALHSRSLGPATGNGLITASEAGYYSGIFGGGFGS